MENDKGIGGVAIAYRKTLTTQIIEIQKIARRIMYIAINTNIRCKKIQIFNTYARHMGYDKDEHIQYWGNIGEILQNRNQKQCTIWATDNNGQIARNPDDTENNTIGPWTVAKKTEVGNGQMLAKTCKKYALCAMSTHFIPHKRE